MVTSNCTVRLLRLLQSPVRSRRRANPNEQRYPAASGDRHNPSETSQESDASHSLAAIHASWCSPCVVVVVAAVVAAALLTEAVDTGGDAPAVPAPPRGRRQARRGPGRRHRPGADRRRAGRGAGVRRWPIPNLGDADRPGHRRQHRRPAVAAGRRRADAAGVDQQGAHQRRRRCWRWTATHGSPPGSWPPTRPHSRASSCWSAAAIRRCRRRRPGQDTWYRGRGPHQRPGRPGPPQRRSSRRRCRSTPRCSPGRTWRPAGIRPTSTAATSPRSSR